MSATRGNMIVVGAVLGLAAVFTFALVVPGMKRLHAQELEVAAAQEAVRAEQAELGDIGALYATVVDLEAQTRDYAERLPASRSLGEYLNFLKQSLKSARIDDYVVEPRLALEVDKTAGALPASVTLAQGTAILPISVGFECQFREFFDFMTRVENMPRLSQVESLRIDEIGGRPGKVRVEMDLHTYYRPG